MVKITIKITINAAFEDNGLETEVSLILRGLIKKLERGDLYKTTKNKLYNTSGNEVGSYEVIGDE